MHHCLTYRAAVHLLSAILAAILILIAIETVSADTIKEEETLETSPTPSIKGQPAISITEEQQNLSGLQIKELHPVKYQTEMMAYGQVVDLKPLLEIRSRYFKAAAAHKIAKADFQQAQQTLDRLRHLHRNDAISTRKLQTQESQWQAARAQLDADHYAINSIRETAMLEWGQTLSDWALSVDSAPFSQLINRQLTLLQITLPPNRHLPESIRKIFFDRQGVRHTAKKADLLAPAPRTDKAYQGETYFFMTDHELRSGMNITAWIPQPQDSLTGVIIPASAVVRHLGQMYVYLKTGEEQFNRRKISRTLNAKEGYFVENGIEPGEKLVTRGAQMLLSEEFRGQIPDEDDDD